MNCEHLFILFTFLRFILCAALSQLLCNLHPILAALLNNHISALLADPELAQHRHQVGVQLVKFLVVFANYAAVPIRKQSLFLGEPLHSAIAIHAQSECLNRVRPLTDAALPFFSFRLHSGLRP